MGLILATCKRSHETSVWNCFKFDVFALAPLEINLFQNLLNAKSLKLTSIHYTSEIFLCFLAAGGHDLTNQKFAITQGIVINPPLQRFWNVFWYTGCWDPKRVIKHVYMVLAFKRGMPLWPQPYSFSWFLFGCHGYEFVK